MKMRAIVTSCVAFALALSACAGPSVDLEVGVKEIDTDVLIGPSATTTPRVPPSSGPPPGFPGFVQPPTIFPPVGPPPPPPPECPVADPLDAVRHAVTSRASAAPVPAGYTYRNSGSYTIGTTSGRFPVRSTRLIGNVTTQPEGDFSFEVGIPAPDGSATTTTYRVIPEAATPADPEAGIYIDQVVTASGEGTRHTFTPTPPLMLMRFPAANGSTWSSRGIDPLAQIVMSFSGRIAGRMVVDACGERIEAWRVEITEGLIRSPSTDLSFTATLGIATQYGGLSVLDTVRQQGTDGGRTVSIQNTARIGELPEFP